MKYLGLSALMTSSSFIMGYKDTSYYPYPGFVNPNSYYTMFWKEADNVLEDLGEFDKLYIRHHACVWSAYTADEEGEGGGGDDDYWYIGAPQIFRANSAYSLYGVLKGHHDKGCNKHSYINSFFTKAGIETLAYPMNIDTTYANSYCYSDGGNSGDRRDRELSLSSSSLITKEFRKRVLGDSGDDDGYYTSIGTGCTADGAFVLDEFGGTQCDGSLYLNTTDYLTDFNTAMSNVQCQQIYSSADTITVQNANQDEEEEEEEEEEQEEEEEEEDEEENRRLDEDGDDAFYYSTAYKILHYSSSCTVKMYPLRCPDPYGLLAHYEQNFEKAVTLAKQGFMWQPQPMKSYTGMHVTLFSIGGVMCLYSLIMALILKHKRKQKNGTTTTMVVSSSPSGSTMEMSNTSPKKSPSFLASLSPSASSSKSPSFLASPSAAASAASSPKVAESLSAASGPCPGCPSGTSSSNNLATAMSQESTASSKRPDADEMEKQREV